MESRAWQERQEQWNNDFLNKFNGIQPRWCTQIQTGFTSRTPLDIFLKPSVGVYRIHLSANDLWPTKPFISLLHFTISTVPLPVISFMSCRAWHTSCLSNRTKRLRFYWGKNKHDFFFLFKAVTPLWHLCLIRRPPSEHGQKYADTWKVGLSPNFCHGVGPTWWSKTSVCCSITIYFHCSSLTLFLCRGLFAKMVCSKRTRVISTEPWPQPYWTPLRPLTADISDIFTYSLIKHSG